MTKMIEPLVKSEKIREFSWKPSFKLASQKCRLDLIQDKVVLFSHVAINRMTLVI